MSKSTLGKLALQERTRREILHKSDLIPPLPDVVVRVMALLNQGDIEPEDLEEHLRFDQVLVAKMLGMVNSPFYGMNRKIASIRDAVMVLGFRGLRSLILATSTADYMMSDYSCYGHSEKGLWRHSLAVAAAAKTLGKIAGLSQEEQEELFIAGLLHDIGKMLVAPYLQERNIAFSPTKGEMVEVERKAIGMDHAEAGALVAAKWNLSDTVQELLRAHHDADGCPDEMRLHLAVLRIADAIAHEAGTGYREDFVPSASIDEKDRHAVSPATQDWEDTRTQIQEAMEAALAGMSKICS
ncbi:MAG: HDOD domain-containing protein [Planctomycetota bacterium]|jgi:putative nucleotidyltransferase with HDIG domain